MGITSPGIGSGLDVKALVAAYVRAETVPLQIRHDNQLKDVNTELSAVGQLKSSLSSLQTSLANLSDLSQMYTMKYNVSEPDYLTATVTNQANKGSYQIEVQKLAQQQSLASGYIPDVSNVGSGTITIAFGTYNVGKTTFTANADATPVTINVAPGSGSLVGIRDAINSSGSGLSAAIVEDNQGTRLTITSSQTGENYSMKISGGVTALNYDPTTGVNSLTETVEGQNSLVKINGLSLSQSSNELKTGISGATLTLKKAEIGKTFTFTISDNKDQLTNLVNDFIKKYNDSMTLLTNLTGYSSELKKGALYQGDPQFRSIKLNLSKWATSPMSNTNSSIKSLADLGITTNKDGLLEIKERDKEKNTKAFSTYYNEIGVLFGKSANTTDANVRINSVAPTVKAGSYDVVLSAYTPGVSMTGTIGDLTATSTDGYTLKGSGKFSGLSVNVLSGSTGARGKVVVSDGFAVLMKNYLDTYVGTKGDLNQRTDQLNKQVTLLAKTQESINAKGASVEARYTKQFNALDVLLSQLTGTSNSLTQQLASLPGLKI